MSVKIDSYKCVGCNACVDSCPGNLIKRGSDGKAYVKRPEDCWGCASCLKACRFSAVFYYLGADLGGRGATMQVEREGALAHWIIRRPEKTTAVITVDRRNANQY